MSNNGEIITLKDALWLKRQKYAGNVVAKLHREFFNMIRGHSENLSLKYLGEFADGFIKHNNCTPTFFKYKGFPSVICTSLNKELVHGQTRDINLLDGDILKIDIGATFEGAIADCAFTYVYGQTTERIASLLLSCQEALNDAIKITSPGNKIGLIGNTIFQKSKQDGFGVITEFGGHGLCYNRLHAPPFVPNKASASDGVVIQPGMSIAIEPMFVLGKNTNTRTLADKWTIVTKEIGVHFEHSVTLDQDGHCHIMTDHGINIKDLL